jgi:hypothetical protein
MTFFYLLIFQFCMQILGADWLSVEAGQPQQHDESV